MNQGKPDKLTAYCHKIRLYESNYTGGPRATWLLEHHPQYGLRCPYNCRWHLSDGKQRRTSVMTMYLLSAPCWSLQFLFVTIPRTWQSRRGNSKCSSKRRTNELQWERCLKDLLVHPRRHTHTQKKKKNQISVSITLSNSILNCSTLALFTASAGSLFHIGAILYVKKFPH